MGEQKYLKLKTKVVAAIVKDLDGKFTNMVSSTEDLRKRESFWQHVLDTFQPNDLNESKVALF